VAVAQLWIVRRMATYHEKLGMLPLRRDLPRVRRLYRAVSLVAGWCSWRCPLVVFLFGLAVALFPRPLWWQVTCDTIIAISFVLLFGSFGFSAALGAVLAKRPDRWFEHVGQLLVIFGGLAFASIGLLGVWAFLSSAFHLR